MPTLPDWVVLHVPHDSMVVPDDVRGQFVLSDEDLRLELDRMTDHHTRALFTAGLERVKVAYAPVSRLVVDVERFEDDAKEGMVEKGLGKIYERTSHGGPLRRPLSAEERNDLVTRFYRAHHDNLTTMVTECLDGHGRCLIIDCHSFPQQPLPFEPFREMPRPEICVGTDKYHTPGVLSDAVVKGFRDSGFTVSADVPFAGALVPPLYHNKNKLVSSVMVEVNRSIYLDEVTPARLDSFDATARRITGLCVEAVARFAA